MERFFNKKILKNIIMIICGAVISAVGINLFLVNANLLSGGVTGISLIIQYMTKFPVGYTTLLLNIPLLIISFLKLKRKFTILSIVGTVSFSFALVLTSSLKYIITINDPLLLCIFGGVLTGFGGGIVFLNRGSTGGLDIVSMLIKKKYTYFEIGKISFAINIVIVMIGAAIFGLPSGLYTLVSLFVSSIALDKMIKGTNREMALLIITEKEEEITNYILQEVGRGVTHIFGKGVYSGNDRNILYTVISLTQLPTLEQGIKEIDKDSFVTILDTYHVNGNGFKKKIV